jgi:hypothetical protein
VQPWLRRRPQRQRERRPSPRRKLSSSRIAPPSREHGPGRPKPRRKPRRSSGWGLIWRIRPPRLLRWGTSSARSKARASRRRLGSNRSSPSSRRPRLPSSASARPGRKRRANSSGRTPHWRRHVLPSSSGMRRTRGSPGSWSRRVCPTGTHGRLARRRTLPSLSCNRRLPLRAPPSSRRRSRSKVTCSSHLSLVG